MRRIVLVVATALLGACDFGTLADLNADQAANGGDELSDQARKIWDVYDVAQKTDADVKTAIADIDGVITRAGSLPLLVKLTPMTVTELAVVGFQAKDPAHAQGMLLITQLDCTLAQIEKLVIAKNQTDLYPGLYDSYSRDYGTPDANAFLAGTPTVSWTTHYQASALGRTYQSIVLGGARRVPSVGPGGIDVLMDRAYLPEPAKFIAGDDSAFDQDYQIELYYERLPGKTIHFYALWRQFNISTLTSESDLYVNIVLGNLSDFDIRSNKICRENNPVPTFQ